MKKRVYLYSLISQIITYFSLLFFIVIAVSSMIINKKIETASIIISIICFILLVLIIFVFIKTKLEFDFENNLLNISFHLGKKHIKQRRLDLIERINVFTNDYEIIFRIYYKENYSEDIKFMTTRKMFNVKGTCKRLQKNINKVLNKNM